MAAVAVVAGWTWLPVAEAADLGPTVTFERGANSARGALRVNVPELNVDGVALSRVLEFLRQTSGGNLVVNWKLLEAANVTKDTPITLSVRELSMGKLLRLVLDQASPTTPLTWTVDANVISITTGEDADKVMITRVYVVDDLVMTDNQTAKPPEFNLQSITQNGQAGGSAGAQGTGGAINGGGGGGLFTGTTTNDTANQETTQKRGEDLAKMIESVIRPDIWRDNGGTCSIRYFSGKLIVTAPVSVQEMIGGMQMAEVTR